MYTNVAVKIRNMAIAASCCWLTPFGHYINRPNVATGLCKFSPDFVSKIPRKTQVLKSTFRAPTFRATTCRARVDLEPDYHQNQWGLCDALFSNYFEDLLLLLFW